MSTVKKNLVIKKGADFSFKFIWKGSDGNPINLTGYTARMQIREVITDASPIISLTDPTDIVLGGVAGTVELIITNAVTGALAISCGVYDLEMINPSSNVRRLLEGNVSVDDEVTR